MEVTEATFQRERSKFAYLRFESQICANELELEPQNKKSKFATRLTSHFSIGPQSSEVVVAT